MICAGGADEAGPHVYDADFDRLVHRDGHVPGLNISVHDVLAVQMGKGGETLLEDGFEVGSFQRGSDVVEQGCLCNRPGEQDNFIALARLEGCRRAFSGGIMHVFKVADVWLDRYQGTGTSINMLGNSRGEAAAEFQFRSQSRRSF